MINCVKKTQFGQKSDIYRPLTNKLDRISRVRCLVDVEKEENLARRARRCRTRSVVNLKSRRMDKSMLK